MRNIESYAVEEPRRYNKKLWDKYRIIECIIRLLIMYSITSLLVVMICKNQLNQMYTLLVITFVFCLTIAIRKKNVISIDTIKYFTAILFGEFFIAMLADLKIFMVGAIFLEVILVAIIIIYLPVQRLEYLLDNEKYSEIHMKRIKKNTFWVGIILSSITILINVVTYLTGVLNIFSYIDKLIYKFMQFMRVENQISVLSEEKNSSIKMKYMDYNTNEYGHVLHNVLIISMIVLIPLIVLTIRSIFKSYRDKKKIINKDIEIRTYIFDKSDFKDEVKVALRHFNIRFLRGNLSNREKVRKIYKGRIIYFRNKGVDINRSDSVWEIENKINKGKEVPINYEEVRYGNSKVSDKDVDFFKKLISKYK